MGAVKRWATGWAGFCVLLAAGAWARCAQFASTFRPGGVELLPSDSHYYVRLALLQRGAFPSFRTWDPYLNFPTGASNIWPPFHTSIVELSVRVAGAARAELGAASVGPAVSAIELVALCALAVRVLGRPRAAVAVALYAMLPSTVWSGLLGNADHHVHESFLAAVSALLGAHCFARRTTGAAIALGACLGLGRLLAPATFVLIPGIGAAWALASWRRDSGLGLRLGAWLAGSTIALLVASTLAWGRVSSFAYEELSLFHPALALSVLACALAVTAWRAERRAMASALVVAGVAATALIAPELLRALGHLARVDPVLSTVDESQPLWNDPQWALELMGLPALGLPWVLYEAATAARRGDTGRLPALVLCLGFGAASLLQARFTDPLTGAMTVLFAASRLPNVTADWPWLRGTLRGLTALGALSLAYTLVPQRPEPLDLFVVKGRPTLMWMREHLPPASADPFGNEKPSYGVAADPTMGNFILLWAQRPAVATMLSQAEAHRAGIALNARILSARDDEEAYRTASANRVRYLLATPMTKLIGAESFDPVASLAPRLESSDAIDPDEPARTTAHFRLVYESDELRLRASRGSYARVYEAVKGAELCGQAEVAQRIHAEAAMSTNRGRTLLYVREASTDGRGRWSMRVPYASTYRVRIGNGEDVSVAVSDDDVEGGRPVAVRPALSPRDRNPP